jgi:hypothetical protein
MKKSVATIYLQELIRQCRDAIEMSERINPMLTAILNGHFPTSGVFSEKHSTSCSMPRRPRNCSGRQQ